MYGTIFIYRHSPKISIQSKVSSRSNLEVTRYEHIVIEDAIS